MPIAAPGHSDCPVCHPNPMRGIHSMVNRVTSSGADLGKEEAVSVYEAISAYTVLGAFAGKEEHLKGSLAPGKFADFAILDQDIFSIPPTLIETVKVLQTFVAGERV